LKTIINFLKSFFYKSFSSKHVMKNHLKHYKKSNTITKHSIKKIYDQYTAFLFGLFLLFGFSVIFIVISYYYNSCYEIGAFLFLSFIASYIYFSFYFIFNKSLLSRSKFIVLFTSYILTILSFSLIFSFLSINATTLAFKIPNYENIKSFNDSFLFLYYSIVTITTLGYGDIIPLSIWAKVISSLEVVLGITYIGLGVAAILSNKDNDKEIVKIMDHSNFSERSTFLKIKSLKNGTPI